MDRALGFYRDILGLNPMFIGEEWSEFKIGEQRLALHKAPKSPAIITAAISLEAIPIEEFIEKLKGKGVGLKQDIQVFPYGKLASFLDSEGNVVGLYEPYKKKSNSRRP